MKIKEVWLLSNGWVSVKTNEGFSDKLSGVYSKEFIEELKKKTDKETALIE